MTVSNNNSLETFSAPLFDSLGSSLYIQDNTNLTDVDLPNLCGLSDFTIEGNDLSEDDQYDLLVQLTSC